MNVKEFYDAIGGNYEEAKSRLMNDTLMEKFVLKFLNTQSLDPLKNALEEKNYEEAFLQSHTLKGVCLNLSFKVLAERSVILTDLLRLRNEKQLDHDELMKLFKDVEEAYLDIINKIPLY